MERIVTGQPDEDGHYWLGQINAPKYVKDLMVLSSMNRTVEQQRRTLRIGEETVSVVAIPLIDIGFKGEDRVHDAILKAMGYGEEDGPTTIATETLQEMWERN